MQLDVSSAVDASSSSTEAAGIGAPATEHKSEGNNADDPELPHLQSKSLRPLTSLKWPYVPDEPSYPDPLKRNDPKPLNTSQYEAIATSPPIRNILASNPRLPGILRSLDGLQGQSREDNLMQVLGVSDKGSALPSAFRVQPNLQLSDNDANDVRKLAEAIEAAVRGGRSDTLGLDWDKDMT